MPSPFPGMNPYLESPEVWPGVHTRLITEIGNVINAATPDRYFADVEERVYLVDTDEAVHQFVIPDVSIRGTEAATSNQFVDSGAATLAPVKARIAVPDEGIEVKERRIVIRTPDDQQIVTVIEVLSPSNKRPGSRGRELYLQKRQQVLDSNAHFIEIDLLRAGRRLQKLPGDSHPDYLICVSRHETRPNADWWPVSLEQALPSIPVPLRQPDDALQLDLQAILHNVYDQSAYRRRLDYSQPAPAPELSPDRQSWIARVVR